MTKRLLTKKEQEHLKCNPYVQAVSDKSITYTDEFKRHFITVLTESFFVRHDGDTSDINITKEIDLDEDMTAYETIFLVPSDPIRDISFYRYDCEKDREGDLIQSVGKLRAGEALCIKTHLPCGIPNYIIKYERFDYVIGKLVLQEDGRGLTNFRTPDIKHTWKSYFYHLVKA